MYLLGNSRNVNEPVSLGAQFLKWQTLTALDKGECERLLRSDLCAQRTLARRLVNGVIAEPSGHIVAEYKARKFQEFKYVGKAEIGKESANTGKIGEYSALF